MAQTFLWGFSCTFLAVDVSVIAWIAQNYRQAETVIVIGAFIVIAVFTIGLVFVIRRAYKRMEQLEEC